MNEAHARESVAAHCRRYPLLQCADLLKFLHHSAFGCGHLIPDPSAAGERLRREMALGGGEDSIEPLWGAFCRVHLGYLKALGLSADSFARLFALSAQKEVPGAEAAAALLDTALDMDREGLLPAACGRFSRQAQAWRDAGFPALHHSEAFRAAYAPSYRVLHRSHAALLPLLGRIDRLLAVNGRAILAIEGGAGSGKSTLAALLQQIYGCTVIHMDDFFLRPEQRTPARYATPGGNIDHERFCAEVLPVLQPGRTFRCRPFDCGTLTVTDGYDVTVAPLTVVEGAYSLHPALGRYYDCAVFLTVDAQLQRQRILERDPDFAQRFFRTWIPLEQAYFDAFDPAGRCDLILEADL